MLIHNNYQILMATATHSLEFAFIYIPSAPTYT